MSTTREEAWELLNEFNKDPFHIQHALTVEGVMRWFAQELGYGDEAEFWGICGLLAGGDQLRRGAARLGAR